MSNATLEMMQRSRASCSGRDHVGYEAQVEQIRTDSRDRRCNSGCNITWGETKRRWSEAEKTPGKTRRNNLKDLEGNGCAQ